MSEKKQSTSYPTRRPGENFERHCLGAMERIDNYREEIQHLRGALSDQQELNCVGLMMADRRTVNWPVACREVPARRYWIGREDGTYWGGHGWSSATHDHIPDFAKTYTFYEGRDLIKNRFWRGFKQDKNGVLTWMRPPFLVPVFKRPKKKESGGE